MKGLLKAIQRLNNCDDLTNLLEIQDAEDELAILRRLFTTQKEVIKQMVQAYCLNDKRHPEERHDRAIKWLKDTQLKVDGYMKTVDELTDHCKEVERSVSKR